MPAILRAIESYALAIYITCTAGVLFYLRFLVRARQEERQAIFSLEREAAATQARRSMIIMLIFLAIMAVAAYLDLILDPRDTGGPPPLPTPTPVQVILPTPSPSPRATAMPTPRPQAYAPTRAHPNARATHADSLPAGCGLSESGCADHIPRCEQPGAGHCPDRGHGQHRRILFLQGGVQRWRETFRLAQHQPPALSSGRQWQSRCMEHRRIPGRGLHTSPDGCGQDEQLPSTL